VNSALRRGQAIKRQCGTLLTDGLHLLYHKREKKAKKEESVKKLQVDCNDKMILTKSFINRHNVLQK